MANRKHVELLKQGVHNWNAWRKEHPSVHPDLSDAGLRSGMLRSANLSCCNLSGSDLRDANLRHADLSQTRLDGARLHRSYISNTRLDETSFDSAILYETVFANVVLSTAKHLARCIHRGPSIIDYRTIAKSNGLPLEFLRGCGLPDSLISEALKSQQETPQYSSCFISYSSKDQEFADRLYADLQSKGVRCWFAPKDISIGAKFRDAIDEGIREREKVLLIFSEHAVSSSWVEKEVETAFEEEQRRRSLLLFPISLDCAVMNASASWAADIRRVRQIGDFSGWKNHNCYTEVFNRLLRDLQKEINEACFVKE